MLYNTVTWWTIRYHMTSYNDLNCIRIYWTYRTRMYYTSISNLYVCLYVYIYAHTKSYLWLASTKKYWAIQTWGSETWHLRSRLSSGNHRGDGIKNHFYGLFQIEYSNIGSFHWLQPKSKVVLLKCKMSMWFWYLPATASPNPAVPKMIFSVVNRMS